MPLNHRTLKQLIREQHKRSPFSGVLYLREKGEIVLAQGYGLANRAEQIPNSAATRLGIASGGKTFTSVAICQLVERGLVTFDTPLKECLNIELPTFDAAVTLHDLLTHSAGTPDYFDEEIEDDYEALWKNYPMYTFRSPGDFLKLFAHLPMKSKPGERWSYNNAGYILLGLVIEHLTSMPYARYVEQHIFEPSGMLNSGFFALDRLPATTALGYIQDEDGSWRSNIYSIPVVGAPDGGAYTTVADLAAFWDALLGGRLMQPATLEKMLTPHWPIQPGKEDRYYGYGLWITREAGETRTYAMIGEDPGVAFFSGYYPTSDIQFNLIGNTVPPAWELYTRLKPLLLAA